MRTIIAGSRDITYIGFVKEAVAESRFNITEIISGGARGVDLLAERYAAQNNIPCRVFEADWNTHKKAAGPIRNAEMAKHADALIAIWDGESRGTRNMIETATKKGLKVYIKKIAP